MHAHYVRHTVTNRMLLPNSCSNMVPVDGACETCINYLVCTRIQFQKELNHQQKLESKKKTIKTSSQGHQFQMIQEQVSSSMSSAAAQKCPNDMSASGLCSLNGVFQGTSSKAKSDLQDLQQDDFNQDRLGALKEGQLVEGIGVPKTLSGPALNIDEVIPNAGVRNLEMNGGLGSYQPYHITFNCDSFSCPLKQSTKLLGLYLCVAKYISKDVQLLEVLHEAIHLQCSSSANSVSGVSSSQSSGANSSASVFPTPSSGTNPVSSTFTNPSSGANLVSSTSPTPTLPLPAPRLLVSGLHTCGDLACAGVKAFARDGAVVALCAVGCCYHLITETFDREGTTGLSSRGSQSATADDRNCMRIADDSQMNYGRDNYGDGQGDGGSQSNTNDCEKSCEEIEHKNLKSSSEEDAMKQEAVTVAFTSQNLEEGTIGVEKARQQSDGAASLGNCGPAGFPMSACLVKRQYSLGRNARMIAAQPPARLRHSTTIGSSRSQFWRALLQLVIVSRLHEAAFEGGCQEELHKVSNQAAPTVCEEQHCSPVVSEDQDTKEACISGKMPSVVQQSELKVDSVIEGYQVDSDTIRSKLLGYVVKCPCTVSNGVSSHTRPIDSSKKPSESIRGNKVKSSCERLNDTKVPLIENPQFNAVFSPTITPSTDDLDQARRVSEHLASASFGANNSLPQNSLLSSQRLLTTSITSNTLLERHQETLSLDAAHLHQQLRLPQSSTVVTKTAASHAGYSTCQSLRCQYRSIVPEAVSSSRDYTAFQLCGCSARAADRESLTAYRVGRRLAGRCTSFEEYATSAIEKLPATLRGRVQVKGRGM